jgi:stage II sporulation protein AA (anti-sigma F factor antagonist)
MATGERKADESPVVAPEGRIDSTAAPSLQAQLLAVIGDGAGNLILDMGRIGYVSSAGLRVLLVASKALDERGGRLVLCALATEIRRVFDLSGFSELLAVVDTRADAQAMLAGLR